MLGPKSAKVTAALKSLNSNEGSGNEILREELELKKTLAAAAAAMQTKRLETASVVEASKNASLLVLQGVSLPTVNKLHFTWRLATVHLSDDEVDSWLACLSWLPTAQWSPQQPTFGGAMSGIEADDPSWLVARDLYVSAALSDAWMRCLNAASQAAVASKDSQQDSEAGLVKLCRAFLHQYVLEKASVVENERVVTVFNNVAKVMRGMVALISPVPGDAGSQHADVEYISPRNATTAAILTELPRVGRLIVNKLRRESVSCLVCNQRIISVVFSHSIHPVLARKKPYAMKETFVQRSSLQVETLKSCQSG